MKSLNWSGPVLASASRVWLQVVAVVLLLLTSANVTPEQFGEFAIASAICMFASVLVGHGLYEYILKGDNADSSPATALWINLASAVAFIVLLDLASVWIDRLFGTHAVGLLLSWLTPVFIFQGLSAVLEPVLLRHERLAYVSASTIIAETLALLAGLAALAMGGGVFALVAHKWTREVTHCAVLLCGRRWKPQFAFDTAVAIQGLRFASGIICSRTGTNVILYGAELIIGIVLSPAAAGLYRLANKIVSSISEVVLYTLRLMLWVRLPPARDDSRALSEAFMTVYQTAGVAYFALIAGVASIAWIAIPMFLQPSWHAAVPAIAVLAVARLVGYPAYVMEPVLGMRNRTDLLFLFNAITGIVSLGLLLVLGRYGLIWASASQVLAGIVWAGLALAAIVRFEVAQLAPLLSVLGRLAVCGGAMGLAVVGFGHAAQGAGLHSWPLLMATILVGVLVYILAVAAVARGPAHYYMQMARDAAKPVFRWVG